MCPTQEGTWYLSYEAAGYTKWKIISLREEKRVPKSRRSTSPQLCGWSRGVRPWPSAHGGVRRGRGLAVPEGLPSTQAGPGDGGGRGFVGLSRCFQGRPGPAPSSGLRAAAASQGRRLPGKQGDPVTLGHERPPQASLVNFTPRSDSLVVESGPQPPSPGDGAAWAGIELPGTRRPKSGLKPFGDKPQTGRWTPSRQVSVERGALGERGPRAVGTVPLEGRAAGCSLLLHVTEAPSRTGPYQHVPLLLGSMRHGPDDCAWNRAQLHEETPGSVTRWSQKRGSGDRQQLAAGHTAQKTAAALVGRSGRRALGQQSAHFPGHWPPLPGPPHHVPRGREVRRRQCSGRTPDGADARGPYPSSWASRS